MIDPQITITYTSQFLFRITAIPDLPDVTERARLLNSHGFLNRIFETYK